MRHQIISTFCETNTAFHCSVALCSQKDYKNCYVILHLPLVNATTTHLYMLTKRSNSNNILTSTPSPVIAEHPCICQDLSLILVSSRHSAISLGGAALNRSCLLAYTMTGTPPSFSSSNSSLSSYNQYQIFYCILRHYEDSVTLLANNNTKCFCVIVNFSFFLLHIGYELYY